jgi:hypothetical protein
MRADPTVAERTLGWLIPADGPRRVVAELLAGAIEFRSIAPVEFSSRSRPSW